MRKVIVAILFLVSSCAFAQTSWFWQNPFPQGNTLTGCHFPSEMTGYACGYSNTIIKTTNGGDNWELLPGQQIPYNEVAIMSIHFLDESTGFTAGDYVMRTTNGGENWQITGSSMGWLESVFAVNDSLIFAGGTNIVNNTGKLYRSTNGGINWHIILNNTDINSIYFFDENTGFAGGDQIRKTTDGGNNWTVVQDQISYYAYNSFSFLNNNTGFAVNHTGVFRTTNGGDNWSNVYTEPGAGFVIYKSVKFTSPDTGYIAYEGSADGKLMKTVNGGLNWEYKVFREQFMGLDFPSTGTGVAVGSSGEIYKTTNAGENWMNKSSILEDYNDLNKVYFADNETGFILGYTVFLKTTDGGSNWVKLSESQTNGIYDLSFVNGDTGFGVGPVNKLYKTTNGGDNWDHISTHGFLLGSMNFVDEERGFAASSLYTYMTTNGGLNWVQQIPIGSYSSFGEFEFTGSTGYVTRRTPEYIQPNPMTDVYKTTNYGANWTKVYTFSTKFIKDIDFANPDTGCAVTQNEIYRTTNGGLNWVQVNNGGSNAIEFADSRNVYTIGLKSTNAGASWVNTPLVCYAPHMRDLAFANADTGFIVGFFGRIVKTTNGAGVHVSISNTSTEIPGEYSLHQNYPNPFNPSTRIKFKIQNSNFVALKVYDMVGRQVATLVNEKLSAGEYEVTFDGAGLSSGVYFYRLQAGEFNETRRMVLLK